MTDTTVFKYRCDHMHALFETRRLTGRQAQVIVLDMCSWLISNVGAGNFSWSNHIIKVPVDMTWDFSIPNGASKMEFASMIFFRHECDLLAFKLRWGV